MVTIRTTLALALFLGLAALPARAEEPPAAAPSSETVKSALLRNKGNRVSVRFAAGDELVGKVAAVSDQSVHLTELAGREFFDAVVAIDDVVAVVFRAKGK